MKLCSVLSLFSSMKKCRSETKLGSLTERMLQKKEHVLLGQMAYPVI